MMWSITSTAASSSGLGELWYSGLTRTDTGVYSTPSRNTLVCPSMAPLSSSTQWAAVTTNLVPVSGVPEHNALPRTRTMTSPTGVSSTCGRLRFAIELDRGARRSREDCGGLG